MTILDRIRRMARANVYDALDKAENPEKLLKQKIRDLEEASAAAKRAASMFAVSFKKLEKEQEQLKRLKAEWTQKAEASLKLGDEELARKSLAEKVKCENRMAELEPSVSGSRKTYEEIKENLGVLQDQLRAAKLKLAELQSRQQAAVARKMFGNKLDKGSGMDFGEDADFRKMEERVLQSEAEAEIESETGVDLSGGEWAKKTESLQVEAELDELKKKLGAGG